MKILKSITAVAIAVVLFLSFFVSPQDAEARHHHCCWVDCPNADRMQYCSVQGGWSKCNGTATFSCPVRGGEDDGPPA